MSVLAVTVRQSLAVRLACYLWMDPAARRTGYAHARRWGDPM